MLGEWAAFEHHYGPLLVHERVDFGMAALRALEAGGRIADHLPPWYHVDDEAEADEDSLAATLTRFAQKSVKEREHGGHPSGPAS